MLRVLAARQTAGLRERWLRLAPSEPRLRLVQNEPPKGRLLRAQRLWSRAGASVSYVVTLP
jgi:hypothetical protein